MFDVRLRRYDENGARGRVLACDFTVTIQESGIARLEFAVSELVADRLAASFLVGVEYSTGGAYVQPRNGLFIATAEDGDTADVSKTVNFVGEPYVPWLLEGMHQRMNAYTGAKRVGLKHEWPNVTPGRILRSLIDHGKSVDGWAPMLSVDFTATKDSAGADWTNAERWSPEFQDLVSIRQIFDAHVNNGLIDWWSEGTKLRVFRPGTGVAYPNVKLGGSGFARMPRKRQYQGQFNYLTIIAEDGARYYPNPGADQTYGRRHHTATLSGVKLADADKIVQPMLVEGRTARQELSYEWTPVGALPVPWSDFQVGDGVKVRTRDGWIEQRVLGVTVLKSGSGITVRATVGSKLLNRLKRLTDKVNNISVGDTGGTGVPITFEPPRTAQPPQAPQNLRVVSNTAVWGADGAARTTVSFAWDEVTQTEDLSGVDGVRYELWGRVASGASARLLTTDALTTTVDGWAPGVARYVKVRAVDRTGARSAFSGEISVTPISPASIVPKAPTGLKVDSNEGGFLPDGSARAIVDVSWDAVTMSVENQPVDVAEYEVTVGLDVHRVTGRALSFTVLSGQMVAVTVRAVTTLGVWGDPSPVVNVTGALPAALSVIPSAPVLTPGMGGVAYRWDGLSSTGEAMPAGFNRIIVDQAASASGPWTTLGASGDSGSIPAVAGTEVFVRFRAFDTLGREAGISAVVSAVATGIALSDIPGLEEDLTAIQHTADGKNRIYVAAAEPVPEKVNRLPNPSFEISLGTLEVRRNLNPTPLVSQSTSGISMRSSYTEDRGAVTGGRQVELVQDMPGNSFYVSFPAFASPTLGDLYSMSVRVRNDGIIPFSVRAAFYASGPNTYLSGDPATINPGQTALLTVSGAVIPAGATSLTPRLINGTTSTQASGALFTVFDGVTVEKAPIAGEPFSGSNSPDPDLTASWISTPNASQSTLTGEQVSGVSAIRGCVVIRSARWAQAGSYSARIIRTGTDASSGAYVTTVSTPDTVTGIITLWNGEGITALDRDVTLQDYFSPFASTTMLQAGTLPDAGESVTVRAVRTSGGSKRIVVGAPANLGESIWVDCAAIVEGDYTGPYFETFTQGDLWLQLDAEETSVIHINVWNGTTWAPQVLFAEDIFATGSITGALVRAGTLEVNHVSPTFGDDLNLSANESVTIIVGRQNDQDATIDDLTNEVTTAQDTANTAADAANNAQSAADDALTTATNAADDAANVDARLAEHQTYYRFGTSGLAIGDPDSASELRLKPERIEMTQNGVVVSYWEGGVFVADEARLDSAQIGNHQFMAFGSGRTIVRPL